MLVRCWFVVGCGVIRGRYGAVMDNKKDKRLCVSLLSFFWRGTGLEVFLCGLHLYGGDDKAIVVGVIEEVGMLPPQEVVEAVGEVGGVLLGYGFRAFATLVLLKGVFFLFDSGIFHRDDKVRAIVLVEAYKGQGAIVLL